MKTSQQLAGKIKTLRELNNYTQEYVANILDIAPNTYSLMEKGQAQYTIDRIEKLAELYKMDITDLLSLNDRIIFHQITNSSTGIGCTDNVNINNNISDEERQLYARFEKDTERLHKENERLNLLILQLIEKLG